MHKQLLCGVAAVSIVTALSGPVTAADLRVPYKTVAPVCTWCGWYVGGHVGYGGTKYDGTLNSDEIGAGTVRHSDFKANGLALGFHAGYNWQVGQWVFGIEGDATVTPGWNDKLTNLQNNNIGNIDASLFAQTQVDWLASIRGRLGMTFDRTLVYATAGVAWVRGQYTAGSSSPQNDFKHRFTKTGVVVGGGIEHKVNANASIRLEGLHYVFNQSTNILVPDNVGATPGNQPGDFFKLKTISVVRIGASWHLSP